jgi:hypothetical protein
MENFLQGQDRKRRTYFDCWVELHITYVLSTSYWVVFDDQMQERQYLSLIKGDSVVTAVYPERTRQGIFYDEVEGSVVKPYHMDDVVIHEGI